LWEDKFCEDPLWFIKQDEITQGVTLAFMKKKIHDAHIASEAARNKARLQRGR
jgi:hypothetical protein